MLEKPLSKSDLKLPFQKVGEPGWQAALRNLFADFDVPPADSVHVQEVEAAEARLGVALPDDWRQVLLEFGALKFGASSWASPRDIVRLDGIWFRDFLSPEDRSNLSNMLLVATTGSDNCYGYDVASGVVHLCSHDPAGIFEDIPNVGALLRFELLGLYCGKFGWPDDEISDIVEELQEQWLEEWSKAR